MRLFRIARSEFIRDITGAGARLYGGRWNLKGTALLYTSETRALAALEYLVHVSMDLAPRGLSILRIDVPEEVAARTVEPDALPADWRSYPSPQELAVLGTRWAESNETLLLRVPSVLVEEEYNVLVNPAHPDFVRIRAGRPSPFALDPRLLGRSRRVKRNP